MMMMMVLLGGSVPHAKHHSPLPIPLWHNLWLRKRRDKQAESVTQIGRKIESDDTPTQSRCLA